MGNLKQKMNRNLRVKFKKTLETATNAEKYQALAQVSMDDITENWIETDREYDRLQMKKTYYFSAEYLPGRLLGNNLMNLGKYDSMKEELKELGMDINQLEKEERDPALGNGGLGRLGSCFLEGAASLGYPVYGYGIKYKYGLFKQDIRDGRQKELPDDWKCEDYPQQIVRKDLIKYVKFGGNTREIMDPATGKFLCIHENYRLIKATPSDIPVVGYRNNIVNTLRLWDTETDNITDVLYPNDEKREGKMLRLKQEYFFVSASLQQIVQDFKRQYKSFSLFPEKVCLHINDTHPSLVVPELMRILMDEEGLSWEEAWGITTKSCAFTNHTIMAEAMEKWDVDLFEELLPRIYKIVKEINKRFLLEIEAEKIKTMAIIYNNEIRMANLAIVGSFSVNGVAKLHTKILKERELKDFFQIMPEKFNNKTNGISHRRFLVNSNPKLTRFLNNVRGIMLPYAPERIKKLEKYVDNEMMQNEFMQIKKENKELLAKYIKEQHDIEVDTNSIFSVQIKRQHEYKRQLLNVMRIMHLYNELKDNPDMDFHPMTFIFAGKAAGSYYKAKQIIQLIHSIADVINNDETINGKLKVVFLKDYSVSLAELIIPGSDVSEQISTASKEASGTGNMKFMMNGAVTIGTLDGANIEICEAVGEENIVIFGAASEEIMQYEKNKNYIPSHIYLVNPHVKRVMDQLTDGTYKKKNVLPGQVDTYVEIWDDLIYSREREADAFFVLKDFEAYVNATKELNRIYCDEKRWARMAMMNVANSGIFSSDRTIKEYAKDIWGIISVFEVD